VQRESAAAERMRLAFELAELGEAMFRSDCAGIGRS
jgi:hypothetical protein